MFPDLTSDDVFRIETPRLWLRWPRASDVESITGFASLPQVARMTAVIPHPYPPGEAERFVMKARADNANGSALVLAIIQKGSARQMIGLLGAHPVTAGEIEFGYIVAPPYWGRGLATEAVNALAEAVFGLTRVSRILANVRTNNPASRRVLEKTGFNYVDTGLDFLPARGGLHPCHRFKLDRTSWAAARKARQPKGQMPPMAHQRQDTSTVRPAVTVRQTES